MRDTERRNRKKWINNLELQYELQLGEAVTGRGPGVFASFLGRPLQHQLQPPLQLL